MIYFFLVGTLLWSYWKALLRLRAESCPLTPILGWMAGLGYFLLLPLTLLVLNGGYTIPSRCETSARLPRPAAARHRGAGRGAAQPACPRKWRRE